MTRMHFVNGFVKTFAVGAMVASTISCGDVVRSGKSPMLLVIDSLQGGSGNPVMSDVVVLRTSPDPCSAATPCPTITNDVGVARLRLVRKDVTGLTLPTSNNEVTISRYRVVYRRADGRNTPGVDVPYPWDGAATGTVDLGGQDLGIELVRHVAKQEAPLVGLAFSPTVINTITEVTFYGQDRVGNEISATGTIQINFGNFGDAN